LIIYKIKFIIIINIYIYYAIDIYKRNIL